jgi:hypothetical protein
MSIDIYARRSVALKNIQGMHSYFADAENAVRKVEL